MSKVLITGMSGSAGSYLYEYLSETNNKVVGTGRNKKDNIYQCDLTDLSSVIRVLDQVRPQHIFNLAANADVRSSFDNPLAVLDNNIKSTANLLEAIRILKLNPIIQHCSTSEVYGVITKEDGAVSEDYPIKPANVYAISKCTQEQLMLYYHKTYGFKVIVTRAFGYINPRRHNIFSTAFAKQVVAVKNGKQDYIRHGNLDSIRTLMDVRDVVKAYAYASAYGLPGDIFNIGSEQPISVGDFLYKLLDKTGLSRDILVEDKSLLRPTDVTLQIPNINKFKKYIPFTPEYTLDQSTDWLLEECNV